MNHKVYIICDPVHGMMKFTKAQHNIISNIIDTPSFQRLRHIKQLSFAEFAFPGAVHTRFNHCIGAAYLSTKVSYALEVDDPELVMISSLLHDIGHGPLSHAFEYIYDESFKIKHELWTEKFITEIISHNTDSNLIEKLGESIKIINKNSAKYKIEQKIVSSQMDVDRFDYLLRDSHFCGVSYGVFDVDWLISCMEKNNEVDNIVISSKGIRCLEHYLMARKLMTQNVCFHNRSSAASYLFISFFKLFRKMLSESDDKEIKSVFGESPLIEYLKIIDDNQKKISSEDKKTIIDNVLENGFEYYKKLTDHDFWSMVTYIAYLDSNKIKSKQVILKQLIKISKMFLSRQLPLAFQVRTEFYDEAKVKIAEFKKDAISNDELNWVIDISSPSISFYETNNNDDIYLSLPTINNDGAMACDIMKESDILPNLSDKKFKIVYLFVAQDIEDSLNNKIIGFVKKLNNEHAFIPNRKLHEFIK